MEPIEKVLGVGTGRQTKRQFDRITDPARFKQVLMTRPVARSGGLLVYQLASEGSHELGFVLPKRLIRNAVQRNQLKRWTKALLHQVDWSKTAPFSLILRMNTVLPKATWTRQLKNQTSSELQSGRNLTRADLIKVINDTMSIKQVRA